MPLTLAIAVESVLPSTTTSLVVSTLSSAGDMTFKNSATGVGVTGGVRVGVGVGLTDDSKVALGLDVVEGDGAGDPETAGEGVGSGLGSGVGVGVGVGVT